MSTYSENLFQLTSAHSHYVNRYGVGVANDSNSILNQSYSDSRAELVASIESLREAYESDRTRNKTKFKRQLREVIDAIAEIRGPLYTEMFALIEEQFQQFSEYEANFQQEKIFDKSAEEALATIPLFLAFAGVSASAVYIASVATQMNYAKGINNSVNQLLNGIPISENRRMFDTVLGGFNQNSTNQTIIRSVFNNNNQGSVTGVTNRSTSALVSTAINRIYNEAHRLTADANSELTRGWINQGVYDSRQSAICRDLGVFYGNKVYPNHSDIRPIPRHPRCRSLIIAVMVRWDKILKSGQVEYTDANGKRVKFTPSQSATPEDLTQSMRNIGMTNAEIALFKNNFNAQTTRATINDVLVEARSRGDTGFIEDFFSNKSDAALFIAGGYAASELLKDEDKSSLTLDQIN
tara:strand:- start:7643 stop:8869 length:1227 start_codon:yes stop_codon:yes gene_type:complete